MIAYQYNNQKHFGGGEVYTAFLTNSLHKNGVASVIFTHQKADFWHHLNMPETTKIIPIDKAYSFLNKLPSSGWWISHGTTPPELLNHNSLSKFYKTAIAHLPIEIADKEKCIGHDLWFCVSKKVKDGYDKNGLPTYQEPLYGIANLNRKSSDNEIYSQSYFDWDHRKVRDHLLSKIEPIFTAIKPKIYYSKKSPISIGVVSRITPIKQLPLLFELISPIIKNHPEISIDFFGAGGYASIRDLKKSLSPIRNQIRFWGTQKNINLVYKKIDYLLTGLAEMEALGLNVIEAQFSGVPVIAENAPPFTETVINGKTGWLFNHPLKDGGSSFNDILNIISTTPKINPLEHAYHLEKFSESSFDCRIKDLVDFVNSKLP